MQTNDLRGVIRLRIFQIFGNLTVGRGLAISGLRYVSQGSCAAFCVILPTICQANGGFAVSLEI